MAEHQTGGSHYKDKAIQPLAYITANKLPFAEGNVIKYVTRHTDKNGAEDIEKARDYINHILTTTYGVVDQPKTRAVPSTKEIISASMEAGALSSLVSCLLQLNTKPRVVVSVGRGGAWAAAQVAYALKAELIIHPDVHVLGEQAHALGYKRKAVLFVDDIYDTGATFAKVQVAMPDIPRAALFYKPSGKAAAGSDCYFGVIYGRNSSYLDLPISQYQDLIGGADEHN